MKASKCSWLALVAAAVLFPGLSRAQDEPPAAGAAETLPPRKVERIRVEDGKVIALADGEDFIATNSVVMSFGIKVMTNLTFSVSGGTARPLLEGQMINPDGMLQSADGTLVPVMDHVVMKAGKAILFKDGVANIVDGTAKLTDGSQISEDGTYVDKSGRRSRLLDGQLIKLDGAALPATDTALLKGGKVILQKDGSLITLRPAQTMMMSDGTKVSGDGTLTFRDGSTAKLVEGETVKLEGVRRP